MEQKCSTCKKDCCTGETTVVCEGFCEGIRRFHANCVGLTDEEADVCLYRNIMWMCDDCRNLMEDLRFRSTVNAPKSLGSPVTAEVECIRNEIAKISTMINEMNETIGSMIINPHTVSLNALSSPPDEMPPLSSTKNFPNASSASCVENYNGTNETFKFYLSNIANDVTEEEVKQMVKDSICVDEIYAITCLKPRWKDVSTMNFISFKVEIDGRHRTTALKSSIWPKGIRYREFNEHTATTWRPNRR